MEILDILDEISRGENIDIHVKNENKHIRKAVAEEGYKLDVLIKDSSDEVRAAVARKGYGLSELRNDRSDCVRFAVLETIDKHSRTNGGYDIINRVSMGNTHIVMGHNASAPSPFVTWEFVPKTLSYSLGHYFSTEPAAIADFFSRAIKALQIDNQSLGIALLTKNDHQNLRQRYREETAQEDILYAIESLCETDDYNYNELVSNSNFMKKAIHRYWHQDHSYENERLQNALREVAQDLVHEKNNTGEGSRAAEKDIYEIKLSPEEIDLYNDLLSLNEDEIYSKYGPLGDDIDIDFKISEERLGRLCLKQISENYEHPYQLELQIISDNKIQMTKKINTLKIPTAHTLSLNNLKVQIIRDDNLRRLGNQFIFQTDETDCEYAKHNGKKITITRALTVQEADLLNTGLMWEAQFDNGEKITVFDQELRLLEDSKEKIKLSEQIKLAKNRSNVQILDDKERPER